jgi:replication factor C small subunit
MTSKNLSNRLWTEFYRPQKLEDLCISPESREILLSFDKDIPNLLFCGVQGTGKTTLAKILVCDVLKCDYLYINASDESGVDTIRTKVSGFAQTKSFDGNIKVVVLDEADFLSSASQAALRNLMESYINTTRFILTGNYIHKIIPALRSRCQTLDIQPSIKDSFLRCVNILKNEGVEVTQTQKKQILILVKKYFPDLRKCINELQKYSIDGILKIEPTHNSSRALDNIWTNLLAKKSLTSRKYLIENEGIFNSDWEQLLVDLLNFIYEKNINEVIKKSMIITIAEHLDKVTRVNDKEINFFACMLNMETFIE